MKNISEYLFENKKSSIQDVIEGRSDILDEGLKDIFNAIKDKFAMVVKYFTGLCARISKKFPVWLGVDSNGDLEPVSLPLTASQAYVDGFINKKSTLVVGDNVAKNITGNKAKKDDASKLYGSGNSLQYWKRIFKEDREEEDLASVICEHLGVEKEELLNEVKMHTEDPNAKYNVVGNAELRDEINYALTGSTMVPLLILGAPGIGKTAILNSVLREYPDGSDWTLVVKTLSQETPDNFFLPKYVEQNGAEMATDVPKTWLPVYYPTGDSAKDKEADKKLGKGLLFIDELSRATAQVLNVCLPLINERKMNGWVLGSGWRIVCASNRPEDDETGQSILGNAMRNRYSIVYYEPTADEWSEWANTQHYISPLLTQWLKMPETGGGKQYFYWDPNESGELDNPAAVMCTPRSWDNAMKRLSEFGHTGDLEGFKIFDVPRRQIERALSGCVPPQAIDGFMAFLDTISKIGNFDDAVYSVWQKGGSGFKISAKDLRLVALPLAQLIISAHADKLPTEKEFDNLCKWLISTGSDQLASYVMDIFLNIFAENEDRAVQQYLVKIKHLYNKYINSLSALPDAVKKLKTIADRNKWFDNELKKMSKSDPNYDKYEKLASDGELLSMALVKMDPIMKKWGIKSIEDMPDYSKSIIELSKKYGNGIKVELGNDEEISLF